MPSGMNRRTILMLVWLDSSHQDGVGCSAVEKIVLVVLRRELGRVHDVVWRWVMHGPRSSLLAMIDKVGIAGGA